MNENSPPGTNVGKPVTAADAPGDILTYTLGDTNDEDSYVIDPATGQISVGPRTTLDTEAPNASDEVEVTATDPAGTPTGTAATVTITIKNVNEAPTMSGGPTRITTAESSTTDIDLNADEADVQAPTYTATDPETAAGDLVWSLEGTDAADFSISTTRVLTFKNAPNYESPADANTDNVYTVTVVATDSTSPRLTATRDVVITITNADDGGVITLSSVQPKVRIPFMASLTDEDGGVTNVKWQWYDGAIDEDDLTGNAIDKATSDTYTPVADDVGDALGVRATYTDSNGSGKSAMVTEANVVVDNLENAVPAFRAGGLATGKVITADTRSIAENSAAAVDIGLPVTATDPNGDNLTYTLGGSDKGSFDIVSTDGQITVKAGTTLNYESKKVYKVTVTATDPSRADATIAITINVTDQDEAPVIAGDDIVKDFKENGKGTVQTFRATDPERRPVYWSLLDDEGDYPDNAVFTISSTGALSFASPPDFEAPSDSDTDNVYKVTVLASDDVPGVGTTINTTDPGRRVTITVTNVSESGSITVDRRYPQVSVVVTATLTDGDATSGEITAATWQWKKGSTDLSGNGADTEAYTPQADDTGTIKVVASYVAKGADRTEEKSITVRAVPSGTNSDPAFPAASAARSVDENKTNTNVGSPVTATDSDDSGKLYYTLSDDANFSINTSGQLKTKAALNHEENATLSVTVTATDPSGGTDEVDVTVTVNDVNEAPTIDTGPTRAPSQNENIPISTEVATYAATDVDGDTLVWSLTGTDASDFDIGNQEGGTPGVLTFKEIPDYEKPAASNNVYRVTVTVSDGKLKATRPMTVTVTDEAEGGVVTLSSVQPKVAVELTASLEDSDGGVKDITWQWARSDSESGTFTNIDGATSATYTPVEGDQTPTPMFLSATASYTDKQAEQTAVKVSDAVVIANVDNRAPMFPDTETGMRSIAENSEAAADIGLPVTATDPNGGDNLTYTLVGTDAASFDIGRSDGQLKTKAKLDYEIKNTYMVTVTATDPNGLSDSIDVTIKVGPVDEAPMIMVGGLAITGQSAIDYAENRTGMVATYSAAGPDAARATWSLEGDDAGDFRISTAGVLTFRTSPDYESPADADTDNTYMVTVKANDGTYMVTHGVTVTVTNVDDPGAVSLSSQTPVVGIALTASLTDADGEITGMKWQWASENTDGTFADIAGAGATSDSYTPADADVGKRLRATASYTDGHGLRQERDGRVGQRRKRHPDHGGGRV